VREKSYSKRSLGLLKWTIGADVAISINVYNLITKTSLPPGVSLHRQTNEEVKRTTNYILQETGEILIPAEMMKTQIYGDRQICLENDEVDSLKNFDRPGLSLIGFKPISSLKWYHHIRAAQFIFPDESWVSGSTVLFRALLEKCLQRQLMIICKLVSRRNSPPRLIALLPQAEELDEQEAQICPSGFHVIFLPFADDIREVRPAEGLPKANQELVKKASEIVSRLSFPYSPESFDNPALQKRYRVLESLALEREREDPFEDHTLPNLQTITHRAGSLISEFTEMIFPEGYGKKPAKRPRMSNSGDAGADFDLRQLLMDNKLEKLTVAQLKSRCQEEDIKISGQTKKSDIIQNIRAHFGL